MAKKKKKADHLNLNERALRNAMAHEINKIIVERSFGNANGTHLNPADRRARTRDASKKKAIKEQWD
jgi:hypothetical protein